MATETPQEVSLNATGISILWDDGHNGYFNHRFLRGNCPCAVCVNEITGQRIIGVNEVPENVKALDLEVVGRYALRFLWSDAHDTGIYPFVLLRKLCQCQLCKPA